MTSTAAISHHLSTRQLQGLEKIGNVMVPGDGQMPSFFFVGCVEHVDRILNYMPREDLKSLRTVLSLCAFAPAGALSQLLAWLEGDPRLPELLARPLRIMRFGLRGLVMSLYYSGRTGTGYIGPRPLEILQYRVNVVLDHEKQPGTSATDMKDTSVSWYVPSC